MMLGMITGALVAGALVILVADPNIHIAVMPLVSGLLLGLVLVILAWRARLPRFHLLAALRLAVGVALAFSGLENIFALSAYYLAFSLALFIVGACVLRAYLRQKSATVEEQP